MIFYLFITTRALLEIKKIKLFTYLYTLMEMINTKKKKVPIFSYHDFVAIYLRFFEI